MPVPFPDASTVDLEPPTHDEVVQLATGVLSAARPAAGNTESQQLLVEAVFESMTGHLVHAADLPVVDVPTAAGWMARREPGFRQRMVHMTILATLVLGDIPEEVAERVAAYSRELGVDDSLLDTVRSLSSTHAALAATDFERNGYTRDWSEERCRVLHAHRRLAHGWDPDEDDDELAAMWDALGDLGPDTIGGAVHRFYRARGFHVPGSPGSAPPLLAQHDWVHVLAGYGTKVEAELEVFAFIARANDDPHGFALLAMVVSLFETGYLTEDAGLFEAFPGQLSRAGMARRVADAMRRGALTHGLDGAPDVDFMRVDWFALADRTVEDLRGAFHVVPKSDGARAAGSVTPWEPGGMSEAQVEMGRALAERLGVPYESFGATP